MAEEPQAADERKLTVFWARAFGTSDGACIALLEKLGHRVERLGETLTSDSPAGHAPDVVVVSVIRGTSPADLVARLRRGTAGAAPLLVVSPNADVESKVGALSAGADDYVTVPYAPAEVLARVVALSRRGRRPAAPTFSAGSLRLNFESRHVSISGRTVPLQMKRLHLLYILMREAPRFVPRSELERELWPEGGNRGDQIRGMIWRVRRELEPLFGSRLIESMPSGGYRFCSDVSIRT